MKAIQVIIVIAALGFAAYVVYHFNERRQLAAANNQAAQLLGQEKYAEARDLLEQATRKDSGNHSMWKNLGVAYEGLGEDARAVEAFERSLSIEPNQPEITQHVAELKALIKAEQARDNAPK